ncbi:hypothetical protein KSS87_009768 [Heliosperma pusillum]|nr:hypothetical protein KSS87_009768 [Heliosperma pusillum]
MQFIRYSHYALNCIGKCPYWSTFIRFAHLKLSKGLLPTDRGVHPAYNDQFKLSYFHRNHLRYTAFIPIYPAGVAGEMWLMYCALPYIKEKDLYGDFFSAMPFKYSTFVQAHGPRRVTCMPTVPQFYS